MNEAKVIRNFPSGTVTPPPSKSLCHRAVICAALAAGESEIENFGRSDDIDATVYGVRILTGAETRLEGGILRVFSKGGRGAVLSPAVVNCGESGSTLRFLLPIAALGDCPVTFEGWGRLMSRPLDAYEKIFPEAGAEFSRRGDAVIVRGPLRGGIRELRGDVSSQFVSGLLYAMPFLETDSEIRLSTPLESRSYVEMTLDVMRSFGVEVSDLGSSYKVVGRQSYRPNRYRVEADYSQAAFFLASAALGRDVKVAGLDPDSIQGDKAILDVLRDMGAEIAWENGQEKTVSVSAPHMSAVTVDAREIPDLVPPIAVLCCFCEGTSRIVNAGRLRMKESDRLKALSVELRKLGAIVEESPDSLAITGTHRLSGGEADAWGDHRVAMAVAVAAIRCDGPVSLSGWRSVNKSYPNFWRDFEGDGQ